MGPKIRSISDDRTYTEKYAELKTDEDLYMNKNVDWINSKGTKLGYLFIVAVVFLFLNATQLFQLHESWTVTNLAHMIVSFFMLHWVKGCPDDFTQGEYNGLTLYEQIDAGVSWTNMKKFFILVPTVLTLVACHYAGYEKVFVIVNISAFIICLIPKLPMMYRVRVFGINSTPGIDTKIEYSPSRRSSRDIKDD